MRLSWLAAAVLAAAACGAAGRPRPPAQPPVGPGGAESRHGSMLRRSYDRGAL